MTWLVIILCAITFGVVEGVTEWLPVSSTGHMILLDDLFQVNTLFSKDGYPDYGSEFWNMFLVVIQLGAIIAVIVYFWKKLWPFQSKLSKPAKKNIWLNWGKTLVGVVPAAIIGLFLDDLLEKYLYNKLVVAITLIAYGIAFIVLEEINKRREFKIHSVAQMSWKVVIIIGLIQCLALIPGTSRSGVTILGAMLLGCDRKSSAEYSFYLSIPVMIGASLLKVIKFLIHYGFPGTQEIVFLVLGFVTACVVSFFAVRWLMNFVKKHSFTSFGIYRIALGLVCLAVFIIQWKLA